MKSCSVTRKIRIEEGDIADYRKLACYHYRDGHLGAHTAVFAMRFRNETIGVAVYGMPTPECELRNVATDNLFVGFEGGMRLELVDRNIRRISRVVIEPRFRSLGLASRLVRETMPQIDIPIIEGMAVMGAVNPFLEKAGMKAYSATMPARCAQLVEAFSLVGIEEDDLIDLREVQRRLDGLERKKAAFIEAQVDLFMQSYGRSRHTAAGPQRTRFVLSKLTVRPVYYIWFNPQMQMRV